MQNQRNKIKNLESMNEKIVPITHKDEAEKTKGIKPNFKYFNDEWNDN